ncbi:FAD-dependent oxidoreductase [Pelomonas aquatica]|jgi:glycine oxidase|uniref:FAD-dependent oxidoreductase n=1 Tax=Pelomonas aquatica TaxID=431058 RepID=A0A9X4R584_9BURK|nr:FAD-dependent oxidoreductase [Pelomonas aquatica]MCY4753726.1 FAD-dependent oxidoreductase [Pelomonas aquatica]MDG0863415.1 FAD-dependent oxidoreductase [Pelomonas aquatica]
MATIAIAGAGVMGRLLAWQLARAGHCVQVVDPAAGPTEPGAAGFTAAGMLSPLAEQEHAEPEVAALGWRSLQLWPGIAQALGQPDLVRTHGSLLLAHGSDLGAAQRVLARLPDAPQPLGRQALHELEPALAPDLKAWLLPGEGQLLPRELLAALAEQAPGVDWHWGRRAVAVQPHRLELDDGCRLDADLVVDTRGLGARPDMQGLRGVRGEVVWLHAPGVRLQRPARLLHPRHRVYIVPRPGDFIIVGASEIESEDRSPVSLRSAVELMAAAHSVLPALAEARIVHLDVNLRPAFADHRPRIEHESGLLRINGLFRHGWLLAPALAEKALRDV